MRAIGIIGAALAVAAGAAAPAQAARAKAVQRPDVAVKGVAAPRVAVAGQQFQVVVSLREVSRRAAASAVVTVNGTRARAVRVNAGGGTRVTVPVTLTTPGTVAIPDSVTVPRDRS